MIFRNIMSWLLVCCFSSSLLCATQALIPQQKNVGLCIMATGRYDRFVEPLINSARAHFCKKHKVTYFVFADGNIPNAPDIVRIEQKRLGWPNDTMMRFEVYNNNRQALDNMDYVFALDADMLFVDAVGSEILSNLVGTIHPGFVNQRGSYDTNPKSLAYVSPNEGTTYFAGGFWGGSKDSFFKLCAETSRRIRIDLNNGILPVWHDESHLNRYFIDHPPTKILTPSYCYPESWKLPYVKRLLALDKNHEQLRKK